MFRIVVLVLLPRHYIPAKADCIHHCLFESRAYSLRNELRHIWVDVYMRRIIPSTYSDIEAILLALRYTRNIFYNPTRKISFHEVTPFTARPMDRASVSGTR